MISDDFIRRNLTRPVEGLPPEGEEQGEVLDETVQNHVQWFINFHMRTWDAVRNLIMDKIPFCVGRIAAVPAQAHRFDGGRVEGYEIHATTAHGDVCVWVVVTPEHFKIAIRKHKFETAFATACAGWFKTFRRKDEQDE